MTLAITQPLSIREFADSIESNRTTVRDAMKALSITGNPQGKGKPTLLSTDEQRRLAGYIKPEIVPMLSNHPQVSIVPATSTAALVEAPEIKPVRWEFEDNSEALQRTETETAQVLQTFFTNGSAMDAAILQMADRQGESLAVKFHARKAGSFARKADELEQSVGKSAGLQKAPETSASGTSVDS